jgi:hypothetical protein
MKIKFSRLALFVALFVSGCATPHTDWNARIGHYTFDQAVIDLGPPDKQARLTDGRFVAEWVTRFQSGGSTYINQGGYNRDYPFGSGVVMATGPSYFEHKLRLAFTAENILSAWSRN